MVKRILREPKFSLKLIKNEKTDLYLLNKELMHLFGYGRCALLEGLKVLSIGEGDNVLVPKLLCNVALAPFHHLKVNVLYYDIDENFVPIWENLRSQIDSNTKAILGVNYFGFPCGNEEIKELCDESQLFYIEDNAHGFLSCNGEKPLGSYGNISIWSFRKTLPIPEGGGLLINNQGLNAIDVKYGATVKSLSTLKFLLKMFFRKTSDKASLTPSPEDVKQEFHLEGWEGACSTFTHYVLHHLDVGIITEQRRRMYEQWKDVLFREDDLGVRILFKELKDGVVPWVFPVIAESPEDFINRMWVNGVEAFPWPYFPKDLDVSPWMKRIVCLPVYPYVSLESFKL